MQRRYRDREREEGERWMRTRLAGVEQAVLHHLGWVVHVIKLAFFTGRIHPKDGSCADAGIDV